ncbi:MAG: N-acetylmuramoyl-L-alanine amidase, partial [Candidatus Gastranaerophilales bacterium]|nr:N-acetylmuramoyl-L-alanine amidase [Candidatus Gastranaerophilales bacterium]
AQRVAFINKAANNQNSLFSTKAALTSVNDEINDTTSHSIKLIFSKPVIYALDRTDTSMDLLLFNVEKAQNLNFNSKTLFESTLTSLKTGGLKLSIPLSAGDNLDIHAGNDAKTLRIKVKSDKLQLPVKTEESIVTTVLPARNNNKKYVVLDPGHGGSDHGAIRSNISEKNITLDISKRVQKLLEKKGFEVYMTRETDETVSLQERVDISENIVPDVFVSIHVNSSNSESPNGLETHYYKDNSLQLAKTVHASLLNHITANNRGLFKSKFYVINHTTAPAILVEIGFLSNPSERAQLVTESRKQATAKAIAEGINEYFK